MVYNLDVADFDTYFVGKSELLVHNFGCGDFDQSQSAQGLIGTEYEDYLTNQLGGNGSFKVDGREFDGGIDDVWWEAKSGNYWNDVVSKPGGFAKFCSDMGHRLKIAVSHDKAYELFSNTPIPEEVKEWLMKKGIPFLETLW